MPGEKFAGRISRVANAEDPKSRTMRVEIDLPNPSGRLRPGMYGRATLWLGTLRGAVQIPASCLAGPLREGKGAVYVVRDGQARLVPVEIAGDDGLHLEVTKGLSAADQVVCHYNGPIGEAVPVTIVNVKGN